MGTEIRSGTPSGPEQKLLPHWASQRLEGIRVDDVDDLNKAMCRESTSEENVNEELQRGGAEGGAFILEEEQEEEEELTTHSALQHTCRQERRGEYCTCVLLLLFISALVPLRIYLFKNNNMTFTLLSKVTSTIYL
ncbi:hypothetical protein EYF80_064670 [Liparis tanakae]|uniref:Uncharacterized protein n=1 Tax=Liparis tanakae TaxID=230148 RepID=A0A4Z2EAB0_9TELE|nr:hypothetical protein EYF80_064670 [Liparis tanakae]